MYGRRTLSWVGNKLQNAFLASICVVGMGIAAIRRGGVLPSGRMIADIHR